MSKLCSNCNAENVDEAKFCRNCGGNKFQVIDSAIKKSVLKENTSIPQKNEVSNFSITMYFIFTYIIIFILGALTLSLLTTLLTTIIIKVDDDLTGLIVFSSLILNSVLSFYLTKKEMRRHYRIKKKKQSLKAKEEIDDTTLGLLVLLGIVGIVSIVAWIISSIN